MLVLDCAAGAAPYSLALWALAFSILSATRTRRAKPSARSVSGTCANLGRLPTAAINRSLRIDHVFFDIHGPDYKRDHPALYDYRIDRPSHASRPFGTAAVALVLALALALVHSHQFTINSLTYIASIASPCVFDSGASFHIVPDISDLEGQHEWWWRENAAQAA